MNVIEYSKVLASSFIEDNMGFKVDPQDLIVEAVNFTGIESHPEVIHDVWVSVYDKENYSYEIDFTTDTIDLIDSQNIAKRVMCTMNFKERRLSK